MKSQAFYKLFSEFNSKIGRSNFESTLWNGKGQESKKSTVFNTATQRIVSKISLWKPTLKNGKA